MFIKKEVEKNDGAGANKKVEKPTGTLVVIFDSSNSMNGKIGGVKKIDLAKKALSHLCDTLEKTDFESGLRVFGNDKSIAINDMVRASKDSKLVVPIGKNSEGKMRATIGSLGAHGRTPIAHSLTEAGKDLDGKKENNPMILLISDGVESCNGDPVAAIKAVQEQGVKVQLHVIGFDLKAKERADLLALAKAGNGEYYDAKDFSGLLKSIDSFAKKVEAEVEEKIYTNPAAGGAKLEEAVELKPCTYTLLNHLDKKEYAWFKVNQEPTKRVAIRSVIQGKQVHRGKDGKFKESEHLLASTGLKMFTKDGKRQSHLQIHGKKAEWMRQHHLDTEGEGVYFNIGSDFGCTSKNVLLEVIVQEAGDLNEGWEAPADPKSDKVFVAPLGEKFYGHIGTPDRADCYKVKLPADNKGLKLDIKFSNVDKPCRFKLEVYDAKTMRKLDWKAKMDSEASLTLKTGGAEEVILAVMDNNPSLYYLMNSYELTLAAE